MLHNLNSMYAEQSVTFMVVNGSRGRMKRLAIYFKDPPLPVLADQEVRLTVRSVIAYAKPRLAIRKKQDTGSIECACDSDLTLRPESQIIPKTG